jgi:hypothetical protein
MQRPHHHPDIHDDDADHCTCSLELREDELTTDADLPPAAGGVAEADDAQGDEDDGDGCGIGFGAGELTMDADLPVTTGGM